MRAERQKVEIGKWSTVELPSPPNGVGGGHALLILYNKALVLAAYSHSECCSFQVVPKLGSIHDHTCYLTLRC